MEVHVARKTFKDYLHGLGKNHRYPAFVVVKYSVVVNYGMGCYVDVGSQ